LADLDGEYRKKFLVVVDETAECDRAVTFAAHRVRRTGGTVVLLTVIEPIESQQWLGVDDVLRAEARERAEEMLDQRISRIARIGNIRTETVIRDGRPAEAIDQLIAADSAIAILVLAARSGGDGPGPLVSAFVNRSGGTSAPPVLITIVPASMTDEQIIGVT
jgi:nucleotide-binding universal stress UspA family protein